MHGMAKHGPQRHHLLPPNEIQAQHVAHLLVDERGIAVRRIRRAAIPRWRLSLTEEVEALVADGQEPRALDVLRHKALQDMVRSMESVGTLPVAHGPGVDRRA